MIDYLPTVNALLNAVALSFMMTGLVAIKIKKNKLWHRFLMLGAVAASTLFLGSYLTYHYLADPKLYAGDLPYVYYPILLTHVILAIFVPFLVLFMLYLAWKKSFERHRRWGRWVFPIWAYVSVTGILVYYFVHC